MKAAVFFDIDGTLIDFENGIADSMIKAIKELRANGHYAILCTGRARGFVRDERLLNIGFDGIVAACGCHVELDGKMVYEKLLSAQEMKKTIDSCRSHKVKPILEGPENLFFDYVDFDENDYFGNRLRESIEDRILEITGNESIWHANKVSCATPEEDEIRWDFFNEVSDIFDFLEHSSTVVEMVPKGHSKATGMKLMCDHLGIDMKDSFAVGDSINDIEMLKAAGTGIAMGNGTDSAKEAADYVTTDINDNGIYNALKHFALI